MLPSSDAALSCRTLPFLLSDEGEALCRIAARVLADRSPTLDTWVRWSPAAPLTVSLRMLLAPDAATAAWQGLLLRGWTQTRTMDDIRYIRLTPLGLCMTQLPPPPFPHAPQWYRAVLRHLYRQTPPLPLRPLPNKNSG